MRISTLDLDRPKARRSGGQPRLARLARLRLYRRAFSTMGLRRLVGGGRFGDAGRLPRYGLVFILGFIAIWTPIALYLAAAPKRYASEISMILPGAGASTSLNLSDIGQATTSANSAYASSTLSPSVTYKNLLESDGVIARAAGLTRLTPRAFGKPTVKLVDETSLISLKVTGASPREARAKSQALLAAFTGELDALRDDEIRQRDASAAKTITTYQASVDDIRGRINALELQSGLTSAEQYAAIVSQTEALQGQVAETDASLRQKEGAVRSLSGLLHVSPQSAALTLKVQADAETGVLTEAVSKAAAETALLEKQYGPNHPKYLDARAREMGVRARLAARAAVIAGPGADKAHGDVESSPQGERPALLARLVTETTDRQGLAAQLGAQRADLATRRQRIQDLVAIGSQLDSLNRDYKIADAVLASALARVNTAKGDVFASYPMVQLVEPATLPTSPSSPSVLIAVGAGVAASLLLAVGLAMAWARQAIISQIIARPAPLAARRPATRQDA